MEHRVQTAVFARGSTTYFNSSAFFPKRLRRDVESLYGFVRLADDFVDATPQDGAGFLAFAAAWRQADGLAQGGRAAATAELLAGLSELQRAVILDFVELSQRRRFDPAWTEAFLRAMQADLSKRYYATEDETLEYVYGSAEVIGLFMMRIMDLPEAAERSARLLGRAMQYINFIRDVDEDSRLGRRYLPVRGSGWPEDWLPNKADALAAPEAWRAFLEGHLERYRVWQAEAEAGYRYIPWRPRAAIRTAGDMYNWTGSIISADPLVVFERKVKPQKKRIVLKAVGNLLF